MTMAYWRRGLAGVLLGLAILVGGAPNPLAVASAQLTIYMASTGSDANNGLTPSSAVGTLGGAETAAQRAYGGQSSVRIQIAPGVYRAMNHVWTWEPASVGQLLFDGGAGGARPVFDGNYGNRTWMSFQLPLGRNWGVTVRHLKIQNYRSAMVFKGDLQNAGGWNGGNLVTDNEFENIGAVRPDMKPAYSAVGLVRTRNTVIRGNVFTNVRNVEGCGGLHVVYMAHGSSNNTIEKNTVRNSCGDAIKARNASNNNRIVANTFENQEGAFFVDSYCGGRAKARCRMLECPSFGNVVKGNQGNRLGGGDRVRIVRPAQAPGCAASSQGRVEQ